jgi:hypothetical protein
MEPVPIDFVTASSKWMDEPFPAGRANDEIDEVHAELVTVDMRVADLVMPYLMNGRVFTDRVGIGAALEQIRQRLNELRLSSSPVETTVLERYSAYAQLLEDVFSAFQVEIATAGPTDPTSSSH